MGHLLITVLQENDEAAEHILDALVLQENDSLQSEGGRGITSSVLWDTLRSVCLHLHRPDLARLCDRRDLNRTFLLFSFHEMFTDDCAQNSELHSTLSNRRNRR
jgi:hypothetical protein